jgi:gliding motility-associated lipoprotein GldH
MPQMPVRINLHKSILVLPLLFSILLGCDARRVFEENKAIPNQSWSANQPVRLLADITDTVQPHNVFVNVRVTSSYAYSNLYLFLETRYPGGKMSVDTLECLLADEQGSWLGKGSGNVWDNQILLKKNVRFPRKGVYSFLITQGMRKDPLVDVADVGLRIERVP